MIELRVNLRFSIFTKSIKALIDESLKDLPLGALVYLCIEDSNGPFTTEQKRQQIVTCYTGDSLSTLKFCGTDSRLELTAGNDIESYKASRNLVDDILNTRSPDMIYEHTKEIPIPVQHWYNEWYNNHKTVLEYLL